MSKKFKKVMLFLAMTLILSGTLAIAGPGKGAEAATTKGFIFIGDSRTVGMNSAVGIANASKHRYVIAKVGSGYSYMSTLTNQIISIKQSDKKVDKWYIVSSFGVNDLYNINNYLAWYKQKKSANWKNNALILVSVNPVNEATARRYGYTVTNSQISSFNSKLRSYASSADGVRYIDCYNNMSFATTDGLHYNTTTYKNIYNYIMNRID